MNRPLRILGILAGCLLGGALLATGAAGQDRPTPEATFKKLDASGDGKLSPEEFQKLAEISPRLKGDPDLVRQIFLRLDTNRDGFLTLQEYRGIYALGGQKPPGKPAPQPEPAVEKPPTPEQLAFFEKKIRPVLAAHCYQCHSAGAEKIRGGLVLDTRQGLRKGGDSGPAVVLGDAQNSLLIKALDHREDNLRMPPKAKLSAEIIADFEKWVALRAPDPREGIVKTTRTEMDIEKGRQFWSFQLPRKPAVPRVKDTAWPRGDSDRFLLAQLEEKGLTQVADAEPATLLRRLYFDLAGLPPTPEQVEEFVNECGRGASSEALEKVVDRLLAAPQFGERWGRHWLDVARYGESSGKNVNLQYPHAWRYRDYVIASVNADKPYDRFIKEQLAGDLLPAADAKQRVELQIATGFLALGPKPHNERLPRQFQMDVVDEQIDATAQAFLGLTAACARCHDHKFDPIPQEDYYALAGIFRSTETCYGTIRIVQSNHPSPLLQLPPDAVPVCFGEKLTAQGKARLNKQLAGLHKERDAMNQEAAHAFLTTVAGALLRSRILLQETRIASYHDDGTPKQFAMGVRERGRPVDSTVFTRGEIDKPGAVVPRGVLQVVRRERPAIGKGSGRLELAEWITAKDNPLTARVMVNRVWLHLFGRGIVATPDNFGAAGQPPSHPELLNYLAVTFMEDGWSVKQLIRRIVLSRAYQLSSQYQAKNYEADPDNALVWRMSKRRLDAEALRDAMLAVGGALELTPPKGSVVARAGDGNAAFSFRGGVPDANFNHRAVYLAILRDQLPESLALFDAADPSTVVGERATTSVPAQGMYLLNSPFVMRLAEAAADRLAGGAGTDRDRVRRAYLRFFARPPTEQETEAAEQFLAKYTRLRTQDRTDAATCRTAWAALCQALFASAEFLYLN